MTKEHSEQIDSIFSENGPLATLLKGYRTRPSQIKMAHSIAEALFSEKNAAVEAGTGIGKSLAYLVPSLLYAVAEGKRGALSTETRTLQNQLITKEIPILQKALTPIAGREIKIELCLGSRNYMCIRKFENAVTAGLFSKHEMKKVPLINEAIEKNSIFTRIDGILPESMWKHIHRDKDFCLSSKCPHFGYCMLQQARLRWNSADILIMNHYLFFTHINTGKTYLPYFDFVVFDEAHAIPDICCKQLGFSIDAHFFKQDLSDDEIRKTLLALNKGEKREQLLDIFATILDEYTYFFTLLAAITGSNSSFRVTRPIVSADYLTASLGRFIDCANTVDEKDGDEYTLFLLDGIRARMLSLHSSLGMISRTPTSDWVFWIENSSYITFNGQPIDPAKIFNSEIFSFYSSLIFSSATLTVGDSFDFFVSRLTTDEANEIMLLKLESEFDYKNNLIFHVAHPTNNPSQPHYADYITRTIIECAAITKGNILVLFNSYRLLNLCEEKTVEQSDYPLISQSEFSAIEAVTLYKKENGALLFGTHSFWQGIDLQGDLLRAVIITQLPFSPPDRPDVAARSEQIEKQGGRAFEQLHIPTAVIKFRQGTGRLLRGENEYGALIVLDSRIINKSYGSLFLNSLPEHRRAESMDELRQMYEERSKKQKIITGSTEPQAD
ncbi:MAG: ATP-dependent DNA helicase [Spirochaetes bacterium]|nr:ATP-dependent DNA helicase [Spirochaetota bacterium]